MEKTETAPAEAFRRPVKEPMVAELETSKLVVEAVPETVIAVLEA